jgi:pyridoxal phosphate enzyme (YggS family)
MAPVDVAANLARVRSQIASAASRSGRDPASIRLVAVTKTFPVAVIRAAYDCGLRDFGENRVQEFRDKLPHLQLRDARLHLIGHLQSNKVSHATGFHWVHTIDSERLAGRLNDAARRAGKKISVLIQINFDPPAAGPASLRAGVSEAGADRLAAALVSYDSLVLRGLMTLPPFTDQPEGARPYFRRLRVLRDRLRNSGYPQLQELSMGMTHDFPLAIEEGATIVRIGTALFGPRSPAREQA